ncbi:MAG: alpha-L-rhamnosidase C-terminal domain-containing protein, partial [Candidatus Odinarchaeota archaeon]
PHGMIKSSWEIKTADPKTIHYHFTIPANTSATVKLHDIKIQDVITEGKSLDAVREVEKLQQQDDGITFKLDSGKYKFEVRC